MQSSSPNPNLLDTASPEIFFAKLILIGWIPCAVTWNEKWLKSCKQRLISATAQGSHTVDCEFLYLTPTLTRAQTQSWGAVINRRDRRIFLGIWRRYEMISRCRRVFGFRNCNFVPHRKQKKKSRQKREFQRELSELKSGQRYWVRGTGNKSACSSSRTRYAETRRYHQTSVPVSAALTCTQKTPVVNTAASYLFSQRLWARETLLSSPFSREI